LEETLTDITLIRSLLDSEHDEAIAFQNLYHSLTGKHPNRQLIQAEANASELKDIAHYITHCWLGSLAENRGNGAQAK
jgi:hypothetical protein